MTLTEERLTSFRPLVLLAEDKAENRRTRKQLFESFDCTAIAVASRAEAEAELSRMPLVDLVVTDIQMPEDAAAIDDESGVLLARYVRDTFNNVPVAGYSAIFEADHFLAPDGLFSLVFPKRAQSLEALEFQVAQCVELAITTHELRIADSLERLESLRREYEAQSPYVEVQRRLSVDATAGDLASIEGTLGAAGYRLRLVSSDAFRTQDPVVVWVVSNESGFDCEVYGQPELYAHGKTEQEALALLAELMALFAEDLGSNARISVEVKRMYDFLKRHLWRHR